MNEKERKRNGILSPCYSVTKRYRFPEFFLSSMKPHSSAFVLEDLFLARPETPPRSFTAIKAGDAYMVVRLCDVSALLQFTCSIILDLITAVSPLLTLQVSRQTSENRKALL